MGTSISAVDSNHSRDNSQELSDTAFQSLADSSTNFLKSNLQSLVEIRASVEEKYARKDLWNVNLIRSMITSTERYILTQRILLIFLGAQRSGKTTVVNSLLGFDLLPHRLNTSSSSSSTFQVIIQLGYHQSNLLSLRPCDPTTFLPYPGTAEAPLIDRSKLNYHLEEHLSAPSSTSSLRVFEILVNSSFFDVFPAEIRRNIRLIDTPGIQCDLEKPSSSSCSDCQFLYDIKSLSSNDSPLMKLYVWVTKKDEQTLNAEKQLFERVSLQLKLRDSHPQYFNQKNISRVSNDTSSSNPSLPQLGGGGATSSIEVMGMFMNAIRASFDLSQSFSSQIIKSIDEHQNNHRSNSRLESLEAGEKQEEDDFWVIDKQEAERTVEEVRLKRENVCFLRADKVKRQLLLIANPFDDSHLLKQYSDFKALGGDLHSPNEGQLPPKMQGKDDDHLPQFALNLQHLIDDNARCIRPLVFTLASQLRSKEDIKDTIRLMSKQDSSGKSSSSLEALPPFIEKSDSTMLENMSGVPGIKYQLQHCVRQLLDFKTMKRRRGIQDTIDKSSSASCKVLLQVSKQQEVSTFLSQTIGSIQMNHEAMIQSQLQKLHETSITERKKILQDIEQKFENHRSYFIFDQLESQLNELIIEYLSHTVQSVADAMEEGDKLIEANKDGILEELSNIDVSLKDGIKSIISEFKRRSMQRANHLLTSHLCISLQQNFAALTQILSTSSILTGITIFLHRLAGKSLAGSGVAGLAVAVGITAVQTVLHVREREKKLKEWKVQTQSYLAGLESEQLKIHAQLTESYKRVYNEVVNVIAEYLVGVSSICIEKLLGEQQDLKAKERVVAAEVAETAAGRDLNESVSQEHTESASNEEEEEEDRHSFEESFEEEEEEQQNLITHTHELKDKLHIELQDQEKLHLFQEHEQQQQEQPQHKQKQVEEEEDNDVFYSFNSVKF